MISLWCRCLILAIVLTLPADAMAEPTETEREIQHRSPTSATRNAALSEMGKTTMPRKPGSTFR